MAELLAWPENLAAKHTSYFHRAVDLLNAELAEQGIPPVDTSTLSLNQLSRVARLAAELQEIAEPIALAFKHPDPGPVA